MIRWIRSRKKINSTLLDEKNCSALEDFSVAGDEWIFPLRSAAIIFLRSLCLCAALHGLEEGEEVAHRVQTHLLLEDHHSAVLEARRALQEFPDSEAVHLSLLRALCEAGEEVEAWQLWEKGRPHFEKSFLSRPVLETMAWSVLHKGTKSAQLNVRLSALLGSAFTNDAKAIPLLMQELRGSNAFIRSVAAKLCAFYPDAPLQEELVRLLEDEKVWYVRLEVIQTLGSLRARAAAPYLEKMLVRPKLVAEEKQMVLVALLEIYDAIGRKDIAQLLQSDRAGLRELGCQILARGHCKEAIDLLLPRLRDTCSDVRLAALNALVLLRVSALPEVLPLLQDPFPPVAITAAWAALIFEAPEGKEKLRVWLHQEISQWRRLASAAIASSGQYGISLALDEMKKADDPFVRVNLALGLIGQRKAVEKSCAEIEQALNRKQDVLWMWESDYNPLFSSLAPSRLRHVEQVPHYPVVVDQMVHLDLLSMLSVVHYPQATRAVRNFLQTESFGITGAAVVTLLQEGDEEDLSAVEQLLTDSDEKIRVQAALILALFRGDPRAVQILQEAFPKASREMQVHILEAIARVGDPQSIPFLLQILKEPFQILRVVAASALIQCLYH